MSPTRFPLDAVRTDGWFERIGEGIGSFQALCDIVGERFVAFSLITGARITALSVDRRNNDASVVDFVTGGGDDEDVEPQRLSLGEFRRRLVAALLADEVQASAPQRSTDFEAVQLHIGVRNLLLAPIYGYSLRTLVVTEAGSSVELSRDGVDEVYELESFRVRLRAQVRDELDRLTQSSRGSIDLGKVGDAEAADAAGDYAKVRALLGAWPAPLAIFIRTPDGQQIGVEARTLIAKGLALLASACFALGDPEGGGEIFRLAVQYAQDGLIAGEVFRRLGSALLDAGRAGEAIAPLRRAVNLGATGETVWPLLARAFIARKRHVAALVCVREARAAGSPQEALTSLTSDLERAFGAAYPD